MRAWNGFRLGAPVALELGPDAGEREQRAVNGPDPTILALGDAGEERGRLDAGSRS
jgi:hypothetical protein